MIVIELPRSQTFRFASALRKRELARFLASVSQAIDLRAEVSVLLTGDERIRELNRAYRGQDKATDVLSFPAPADFAGGSQAGDLAISLETASRQAADCGHGLEIEVRILMLHGLLHLAGYDHEKDAGEMARRESSLRKEFALPSGLVERSLPAAETLRAGRKRAAVGVAAKNSRSNPRRSPGSTKR